MGFCSKLILFSGGFLTIFVGLKVKDLTSEPPVPVLPRDVWWGPGERGPSDDKVMPFKIDVPYQVIEDLKKRLTTFLENPITSPLEGVGFEYGFNSDYLKTVVQHWRDNYDWNRRQKFLNSLPQYTTTVNGLKIHYIRARPSASPGVRIVPLLLLHGWSGSARGLIPFLTNPNDQTDFVFDVIAPSLPGYAFSQAAAKPGFGPAEMAVVLNNLMEKIGHKKYYVQGGDWGALLSRTIGTLFPENVLGVHSDMCLVRTGFANLLVALGSFYPSLLVEKRHEKLVYPFSEKFFTLIEETGYYHIQATKPDTIGTALTDSPAGLAAYLLEKFSFWTNKTFRSLPDGGLTKKYSLDALLDDVMIYWITNSITTSQRLYAEANTFKQLAHKLKDISLKVPSACARFATELTWQPEFILRLQYKNLVHLSDFEDGGHFAALESPRILAQDIFVAIDKMENLRRRRKT